MSINDLTHDICLLFYSFIYSLLMCTSVTSFISSYYETWELVEIYSRLLETHDPYVSLVFYSLNHPPLQLYRVPQNLGLQPEVTKPVPKTLMFPLVL